MSGKEEEEDKSSYDYKTKRLVAVTCIEAGTTLLMVLVLYCLAIVPLWDTVYIDMLKEDWEIGPIIDIKMIDSDDDCESGYEPLAKSWWWGIKRGCDCPSVNKAEVCTVEEQKKQCFDQIHRPARWLEKLKGERMCGKRADNYNFLKQMENPVKYTVGAAGPIKCKTAGFKVCGNADTSVDVAKVWCIPDSEPCPVTYIKFNKKSDGSHELVTETDAKFGEPIVDVQMSQGSFPCIHYKKSHNVWGEVEDRKKTGQKNKQSYPFLPVAYKQPCETVTYGNVTLSEADHIFEPVMFGSEHFALSEKELLKENRKDYEYNDILHWKHYKGGWDKYMYYMYQKSLLEWKHCEVKGDDDFTSMELLSAFTDAEEIERGVKRFYNLLWANFFFVFLEVFVVILHRAEAINKKHFNIVFLVRRLLSIFFYVFGIITILKVWAWEKHDIMNALGEADDCHNDKILDASFDEMQSYVQHIQGGGSQFCVIFFMIFVILAFLASTFLKFFDCDKAYKDKVDDNYEKQKDEPEQ